MAAAFAVSSDVETALLRPLTTTEENYVPGLLDQASALLRTAAPSIDDRIARYAADPTDPTGVDPLAVATVVAGAVKRYMVNPTGLFSESKNMGPFSTSRTYKSRYDKSARSDDLAITADDLAVLFPDRKRLRAGTIRTRPALAPRPVGRYGPIPSYRQAVASAVTFDRDVDGLLEGAEQPIPIIIPDGPAE